MARISTSLGGIFTAALMLANSATWAATASAAAQQFLQDQAQIPGSTVSVTMEPPAATLPPCADPQAFLPSSDQRLLGRVTVGVHCGNGQTRYLQARITATGQYWVAAEDIPTGTLVSLGMLAARKGDLNQLPRGAILDPIQAVGRMTTRNLAQGAVLQSSELKAPWLVHSQQPVSIEALGPGFRVNRDGQALQNGALGDSVRVRLADRSIVVGVVAGNNLVKVSF